MISAIDSHLSEREKKESLLKLLTMAFLFKNSTQTLISVAVIPKLRLPAKLKLQGFVLFSFESKVSNARSLIEKVLLKY